MGFISNIFYYAISYHTPHLFHQSGGPIIEYAKIRTVLQSIRGKEKQITYPGLFPLKMGGAGTRLPHPLPETKLFRLYSQNRPSSRYPPSLHAR